jgi:hypothetical protein
MTEQEACGQAIMEREEMRAVTIGDLLDMREALNAALDRKLGRKADSYFNIEMGSCYDDQISFCLAYSKLGAGCDAVVNSYETFATPQQAFDYAMEKIESLKEPTKQDQIDELKKQIEELENE